jgi:hypothetical protein
MATDDLGNQAVAFEWGNLPMQPNNERTDNFYNQNKIIGPALGTGDSHNIHATDWDSFPDSPSDAGNTRVDGSPLFRWPSYGTCYTTPLSPGGRYNNMFEYLRSVGVDPATLKEATFTGGSDQYDWQNGEWDSGILFWAYIAKDEIISIDWGTGTVYTGKDFDGLVIGSGHSAGQDVATDAPEWYHWFTAFTNDPAKNNTANWL